MWLTEIYRGFKPNMNKRLKGGNVVHYSILYCQCSAIRIKIILGIVFALITLQLKSEIQKRKRKSFMLIMFAYKEDRE